jgi:hypothetical protein
MGAKASSSQNPTTTRRRSGRQRSLPSWLAPAWVRSITHRRPAWTAASLVILWRYLRGDAWRDPWYAWTLVAAATAVSVALNVAHAPDRLAAQLFAALPPVALLGALELLMSVARTGLPHTSRTPSPPARHAIAARDTAARTPSGNGHRDPAALTPAVLQDRTGQADQDTTPAPDARSQVRAGRPRARRRPGRDRGRGHRRHRPQPPPRP